MYYQKLNHYVEKYPSYKDEIKRFDAYLVEVSKRKKPYRYTSVRALAFKLKMEKSFALTLLGLAQKSGIVKPKFYAHSPGGDNIGEFNSLEEIPNELYSDFDGETYDFNDVNVEVLFHLVSENLVNAN